jgi:hypothetical protein
MEAVDIFLSESDGFVIDTSREKVYLTWNPRGYLKQVKGRVVDNIPSQCAPSSWTTT